MSDSDIYLSALACITTKEEFNQLVNQEDDAEYMLGNYDPDKSFFAYLTKTVYEHNQNALISYTIDWFINKGYDDTDDFFLKFVAECIREACEHDRADIIDLIHRYNISYSRIRDNCYQFAYGWDWDDYYSSPLVFAINANSHKCFNYLLKWMREENADINKEGYYDIVSPSGNRQTIFEILAQEGKTGWIAAEQDTE